MFNFKKKEADRLVKIEERAKVRKEIEAKYSIGSHWWFLEKPVIVTEHHDWVTGSRGISSIIIPGVRIGWFNETIGKFSGTFIQRRGLPLLSGRAK